MGKFGCLEAMVAGAALAGIGGADIVAAHVAVQVVVVGGDGARVELVDNGGLRPSEEALKICYN